MDLGLKGKTAIVTGASRGLGRAIARELAQEGMSLMLVARDGEALYETARMIKLAGGPFANVHACDLSLQWTAQAVVEDAVKSLKGIDFVVNSAGATKRGDFFSLTDQDFHDGYELKFHGTVRMCRAAWPHLVARKGGIVNIVGVGANTPSADFTIGGSVNAALQNFGKSLADIGGKAGVRVNTVNPGYIRTERLERRIRLAMDETRAPREQVEAEILKSLGVERFGAPEEIGRLCAFLASERSAYIHGAALNIDGGATKGI